MGDVYWYVNRSSYEEGCSLVYPSTLFFHDFWIYRNNFRFVHTEAFFNAGDRFAYPAFSGVVYDLLYHLGAHAQAILVVLYIAICSLAAALFYAKVQHLEVSR